MSRFRVRVIYRFDATKSTKGASKLRRDLINAEIANLRDLLPLPPSTRQRLSQLQLMALVCVYVRKANYFQQGKRFSLNSERARFCVKYCAKPPNRYGKTNISRNVWAHDQTKYYVRYRVRYKVRSLLHPAENFSIYRLEIPRSRPGSLSKRTEQRSFRYYSNKHSSCLPL